MMKNEQLSLILNSVNYLYFKNNQIWITVKDQKQLIQGASGIPKPQRKLSNSLVIYANKFISDTEAIA